jgi:hypothetical protein
MGEMRRAIAREEQERTKAMAEQKNMTDRFASTLVIRLLAWRRIS